MLWTTCTTNSWRYHLKGGVNMGTWLKCAGIRAIKTIAQTAVATVGTSAVMSAVDWKMVVSASVLAGVLSLLTSVAGLPEVKGVNEDELC